MIYHTNRENMKAALGEKYWIPESLIIENFTKTIPTDNETYKGIPVSIDHPVLAGLHENRAFQNGNRK